MAKRTLTINPVHFSKHYPLELHNKKAIEIMRKTLT